MVKIEFEIFIPVYNESENLEKNLKKVRNYLDNQNISSAITIVNDNSSDNTKKILNNIKKKYALNILNYSQGPSRRENLARAMSESRAKYIIFMDFDLATDIKHLPELIRELKKGNDVVIGSRYLPQSVLKREKHRLLISKPYNLFMRIYFGSKIKDHQCGFKGFNAVKFKKIQTKMGYDQKYKRGWFWDVEFLVRAQKDKYKIMEIPVNWTAGKKTSFNIRRELRMVPKMLGLRFKL
ncbi:MAG: glycosyltransferase [Candidatus Nanoarchaeia archaeon]